MRTTNNMLTNNMLRNIGNNLVRMQKFQNQLSTGKKISVPSDDPIIATRALKFRTDVAELEQYKRNATDARSWMEITESSIGKLNEVMQRTRELMVQGANGTYSPNDLNKMSEEISQLKEHTIQVANSTYAGRYIFSGFKTDKKLMDEEGNFAIEVENTERMLYEVGVGDDMSVNVPGGDLFNGGDNAKIPTAAKAEGTVPIAFPLTITTGVNDTLALSVDGENINIAIPPGLYANDGTLEANIKTQINIQTLIADDVEVSLKNDILMITSGETGLNSKIVINTDPVISNALADLGMATVNEIAGEAGKETGSLMKLFNDVLEAINLGDNNAIGNLLTDIDREMENILRVQAEVGGKLNRTELTLSRQDLDVYNFTKLLSDNEDADMAETIMNLQNEENVYRASLSGGAKIIQPSLVDFLQ